MCLFPFWGWYPEAAPNFRQFWPIRKPFDREYLENGKVGALGLHVN